MEYVNFEKLEEVRLLFKIFLVFITIPALSWWWNFITSFFITEYKYEDDNNNCCPHCHVHVPKPDPTPSSGGVVIPPMKIPALDREYHYLDRK